jgi:glycine/D-amino acid oxidase-like deaminating enzyme
VLGAGIVGVTSAYQLARAGHEVTVIERQPGPALETSFANAGEISFGYCSPWAAPGIPAKAIKWLFMKHPPLILRLRVDVAMLSWLVKMLSNCTSTRYAINKSRMLRLADYSRTSLAALRGAGLVRARFFAAGEPKATNKATPGRSGRVPTNKKQPYARRCDSPKVPIIAAASSTWDRRRW